MTARIRWEDNERRWDDGGSILGRVGTCEDWLFQIAQASNDPDDETLALTLQLPGADHRASEITQGDSPVALKAEAERWLAGFVSSLGAIFPEPGRVAVNEAALETFIHEARSTLDSLSQEFCVGAETERAAAEFEALVTALGIAGKDGTSQ